MDSPVLAIGTDEAGLSLAQELKDNLESSSYSVPFFHSLDYPLAAQSVVQGIQRCDFERAILICGTGIGMSMVANRWSHIRAALVLTTKMAQLSREHNDANILCLGARLLSFSEAKEFLDVWLNTSFSGEERHFRRLDQMKSFSLHRRSP